MAVVGVVSLIALWVVLVSGVVRGVRELENYRLLRGQIPFRSYNENNEHFRFFPKPSSRRNFLPFDFYEPPSRRSQENFGHSSLRGEKENGYIDNSRSRYGHAMYPVFIPVHYNLNTPKASERISSPEYSDPPRLVMDKDFNIRFDNPYIMPLTKPLALILNSDLTDRDDRPNNDKMMIPFPVLVKARNNLEREGLRECRDDDVVEHRSNDYDDGVILDDASTTGPAKNVNRSPKTRVNGTTTFHNTNHSPEEKDNSKYNRNKVQKRLKQNRYSHIAKMPDYYNSSSQEYSNVDVYPSKIFADMYKKIPKYSDESHESEEFESYKSNQARKRHSDVPSSDKPDSERPKPKPNTRHPYRGHAFSASTDLVWVTHTNSTKPDAKDQDKSEGRIVIFDVNEGSQLKPTAATITLVRAVTSIAHPPDMNISKPFWTKI